MGWLGKLFSVIPKREPDGIRIDINQPFWELDGQTDFPHLLRALEDFLPKGSILYFEGGFPNEKLLKFFKAHAIPEQTHIAVGILWPKPVYYHVPATPQNLRCVTEIAKSCAYPELAIHFHVYHEGKVLLEWHDVFTQPMLLSDELHTDKVKLLAKDLNMKLTRWKNSVEQADESDQ